MHLIIEKNTITQAIAWSDKAISKVITDVIIPPHCFQKEVYFHKEYCFIDGISYSMTIEDFDNYFKIVWLWN